MTANEKLIDEENRDVKNVNGVLKVNFEEIFGEPRGIRSFKYSWKFIILCYTFSKNVVYYFLSFLVAPILALVWGIVFAVIAFFHIWMLSPALHLLTIGFEICHGIIKTITRCILRPLFETCGAYWSQIRIKKYEFNASSKDEEPLLV